MLAVKDVSMWFSCFTFVIDLGLTVLALKTQQRVLDLQASRHNLPYQQA
jgi:hypothetical protein